MHCLQYQHDNASDAKFCNQCGTPIMAPASALVGVQFMQQEAESESRFQALIRGVMGMLQREQRVTYRTLKYVFRLDDGLLEEVKKELVLIGRACDEDGKVLIWTGETQPAVSPAVATPSQPAVPEGVTITETRIPSNGPAALPEAISVDIPSGESMAVPEPVCSVPDAERRQLTVMFCDLVGSTDLSGKLDPEDLREVVRAYQATAAEVIERYKGHIAQYLGDGLLIYFGFPVAHEDDAHRAVYTGWEIPEAMAGLNTRLQADYGVQLAVRIGIHTGPVVVGEMGGGGRYEHLALGETPNIAARLEGLAQPNTAVMSPVTAQLVQRSFILEELGPHELKGVAEPMPLYAVVAPRSVEPDNPETMPAGEFDALVGRDEEIGLLLRRWEQSKDGFGQVVLISGEAGIGKSSLVEGLWHHVREEGLTRIAYRCSPYHTNSALYPIIDHVQRALGWQPDDAVDMKLGKLDQALGRTRVAREEAVPLLAGLLSLPLPEGRYPALRLSPQQQRQQTQDILVAWLLEEAEHQPVLAVWEDLHWADPSTLEILGLFVDQAPTAAMLHVLTFRPEFEAPWPTRSHLTPMTLNRLERAQVEALVRRQAGDKALPADVVQHIVAKTDGVPLYVEELTKMLLASDLLWEEADAYVLTGPLLSVAIPDTLQDSLMARLDQMNTAKEVAQLGSVLGREFAYEMLESISPMDAATLQAGLGQLIHAELLYQRGRPPRSKYIFKHALIQDAAYASLLKSTRQRVHQQIVQLLETRFPEVVETQPELVAHHYTEADLTEQALVYWHRAGERAVAGSAHVEAIGHLRKGLTVLHSLPDGPERTQHDLLLHSTLGPPLIATKGYAAPEVEHVYTRARELCGEAGDTPQLGVNLYGLWTFYTTKADYETARTLGEQLLILSESVDDTMMRLDAHLTLGCTSFFEGEFGQAHARGQQGLALYDPQQHQFHALQHPGVISHIWMALPLWFLGYPQQALMWSHEALTLARSLDHPFSLAVTLTWLAMLHQCRRDGPQAQALAEEAITLSREEGFPFWLAVATLVWGWALIEQGQREEGVAQIHQGVTACQATGARIWQPYQLSLLAEAHDKAGQVEEAQQLLTEASTIVQQNGERYWEAEIHRLQGELLLSSSAKRVVEAEACFNEAIEVARRQLAKSLELRAAMSLSRLWQHQDKRRDAYDLLATVYNWFTEGFDTADLQEAKVLLEELNA